MAAEADKVYLDGVIVEGEQDALLLDTAAKDKPGRAYIRNSHITGNTDFIFGRAT